MLVASLRPLRGLSGIDGASARRAICACVMAVVTSLEPRLARLINPGGGARVLRSAAIAAGRKVVSSIARAVVIPKNRFYHVSAATHPKRRLFEMPVDRFEPVLAAEARLRLEFAYSGFVLAKVLSYPKDSGIDLMKSEHWAHAETLSAARRSTCYILTHDQRVKVLNPHKPPYRRHVPRGGPC